ncbi:MAG: HEAT repeat domain-containing protein, partial [Gammaproteobacteria bacterium]
LSTESKALRGSTQMKIFLSYASEQSELAKEIALALRAENHTVFFDRSALATSEAYNAKIREAIENSHLFVFLISPYSVTAGRYTLTELDFAEHKWPRPWGYVLSVMVMPTPKTDIPPYLRAGTVLQPSGNVAATIAAEVHRIPKSGWLRILQRFRTQLLVLLALAIVGVGAGWWYQQVQAERAALGRLFSEARIQQDNGHYEDAWRLFEEARSFAPENPKVHENEAKLAMAWLEIAHYTEGKGSFSAIVDKVLPALSRCSVSPDKRHAADCFAHMGWADFRKSREGQGGLNPDQFYQQALALDPENAYAHAMWGHGLIVIGNHLAEAQQHFAAALKGGRERKFVRELQLAALQWGGADENAVELIRVCNEMRKENDLLPQATRSRLFSSIYIMKRDTVLAKLEQILPADEHLATFQWLIQGIDSTSTYQTYQTFFLARLLEAGGDCGAAQPLYVSLLGPGMMSGKVREGIERCKRKSPQLKSEVELLTESLYDKNALVRRQAVEGLSAVLADGARIDAKVFVPALRDHDSEVRAAAAVALARSGRQAIAPMIELLGSTEPADQARAARILAMMGADSKAAVPALVRLLGVSDDGVQQAALDALASIGLAASAAVTPISRMLAARPSLAQRIKLIYALGEIGPPSEPAVPLITEALRDQSDREGFLNANAADALGKIGPGAASAVPALIVALGSDDVRLPTRATVALGTSARRRRRQFPRSSRRWNARSKSTRRTRQRQSVRSLKHSRFARIEARSRYFGLRSVRRKMPVLASRR